MDNLIHGFEHHKFAIPLAPQFDLVGRIDAEGRWEPDYGRQAQRHGFGYDHKRRVLYPLAPFPDWLQALAGLIRDRGWMRTPPDQATVQWYSRQSYIDGHIDDPKCFQEDIATISLASSALYWLSDGARASMHVVEPGDVVVLRGDARKSWKHGVARPKLNDKLEAGSARIVTEHGSPRLELGVRPGEKAGWRRLSVTFRSIFPDRIAPDR